MKVKRRFYKYYIHSMIILSLYFSFRYSSEKWSFIMFIIISILWVYRLYRFENGQDQP